MNHLEIRLLEYFLAVCEELHFTRAAEKLGISQPTLSQQIRILESRVGTKLFHQVGRKTQLTDAGKALQKRAKNIFFEVHQALKEIHDTSKLQRGNITIGSIGNNIIYSAITSFHNEYPNINISVLDTTTKETVQHILDSNFDLGIVFLPVHHHQLKIHHLYTSEFIAVCSKENKAADLSSISLTEISRERVFLLHKNFITRKIIDDYCEKEGIPLIANVELSDMNSLLEFTKSNNGITILPRAHLEQTIISDLCLIPISDPLSKKDIGIIYRKDSYLPAAVRAFMQHLFTSYRVRDDDF